MEFKSLLKVLQKEHATKKSQLDKLEFAIGAISELAGGRAPITGKQKRRTMSAAARAKIGAAQRARWAKQKKAAKG